MIYGICSANDCTLGAVRKQLMLCEKHYYRLRRHGDTSATQIIVGNDTKRFWSQVRVEGPDECWEWQGCTSNHGYGVIKIKGKTRGAHLFSLELAQGKTKPPSLDTCHTCDNRVCVNPGHLYWGTRQQNINDAWERNRMPYGERKWSAKLAEDDIVALRKEYAAGAKVSDLILTYGLKDSTIRCIVLGFKWKRAGGPITRRYKKEKVA